MPRHPEASAQLPQASALLAERLQPGERVGTVLGDTYAIAATSVLKRWEQLEDQSAERRFRQRGTAQQERNNEARRSTSRKPLPPTK
jgi:hypothetical protein